MSWVSKTLSSSLGRKLIMSLTGLFLILFLVVHLGGNLQLLISDEGKSFNIYADMMGSNPLIRTVSILNFTFILLHVVYSVILTRKNKKARPVSYALADSNQKSVWASKNMGILGTLILIFLLVHLRSFWYELHFGNPEPAVYGGLEYRNVYLIVAESYKSLVFVGFYVISMIFLGFHLSHGFMSAFQTLGLSHVKYSPIIRTVGIGFAILVPGLFAMIPIVMYFQNL